MAAGLHPHCLIEIQHSAVQKIIQGITLGISGDWLATVCGAQANARMVVECAANRVPINDRVAKCSNYQFLYHMAELTNIAGPGVIKESINGVIFNFPRHCRFDFLLSLLLEILREQRNVGRASAQKRSVCGQHRNYVKEILPESTCRNLPRKVTISGRNHAYVDLNLCMSSHWPHSTLLQNAR